MEYYERKGTSSYKWDGLSKEFGESDLLAMWVADMDFKEPPCVTAALEAYVKTPLGYYSTPNAYYDAFIEWEKQRHGYEVKREWLCFAPGIVPAINWLVHLFTKPSEGIIILTPVYYPFIDAVKNCEGRKLIMCDLVPKETHYEVDFARFERDIEQNNVKMYIMSNPHNPVGRVWTEQELREMMDICRRHGVLVLSDEIHQDIINPALGRAQIPAGTVGNYDDMLITLASASKTFNLAAIQNSFVIIPDEHLRAQFDKFQNQLVLFEGNGFGYVAAQAAFEGGHAWLEEILQIIYDNYHYLRERFEKECSCVKVFDLQGTYLAWMSFETCFDTQKELQAFLQGKCKLALDYGAWFGGEKYDAFARMNLATSRENIKAACDRIIEALR